MNTPTIIQKIMNIEKWIRMISCSLILLILQAEKIMRCIFLLSTFRNHANLYNICGLMVEYLAYYWKAVVLIPFQC